MHPLVSTSSQVLQSAIDWWNGVRPLWSRVEDVDRLKPEEVERLASEIGVTREEFLGLICRPGGSVDLLHRRLAGLGLDVEEIARISPLLLADLERTCAACADRGRCVADMAEGGPLPDGWESYCPNAGTLKTLE